MQVVDKNVGFKFILCPGYNPKHGLPNLELDQIQNKYYKIILLKNKIRNI